jgi:TRAP transporter TAXI family solute receptor
MKSARFIIFVAGVYSLITILFLAPVQAASELIPFYTPPAGGGAYILGAGIVSVTNKYLSDVKFVHEACSGTMDIVRRMMMRESQKKDAFGVFGTVDSWRAFKGQGEYAGKPFSGLRAFVFVLPTDVYLVVPANSPIKSYADAKGKRLGVGGPGSTPANTALFLLEQHGVTKENFKPYYYVYKETVEGIQDGSLDGGFLAGGYPIASYTELSLKHDVRIVPVDEKLLTKIVTEHPYYYRTVVKAKSYKGVEQDVPILGFTTAVFTHSGVSADLVYKLLKNLFDHKADYYSIHASAKAMNVENATKGIPLPFHPGAERYLKEIGAIK